MDYKEKYEEALDRAKSLAQTKEERVADLEYIFPELHESEDERIRKSLLRMISDIDGGYPFENYGIIKKDVIAYLEKQKEQKAVQDSVAVVITNRPTISKFEAGKAAVLNNPEEYGLCKPAEWSEEDERLTNTTIAFLKDFADKGYENAVECIDWLKARRPQSQWKPSKEQIEALECAERWYSDNMGSNSHLWQLLCDLKKL